MPNRHLLFVFLTLLLVGSLASCRYPRCKIKDCYVRMKHRHDGERIVSGAALSAEREFITDATRVGGEKKGIFSKIFKKKPKTGPDENDLQVDYNPDANEDAAAVVPQIQLKPDTDQAFYDKNIRPGLGPEPLIGKPETIYRGVPWWYPYKNEKIAQHYKPGYRYIGYRKRRYKPQPPKEEALPTDSTLTAQPTEEKQGTGEGAENIAEPKIDQPEVIGGEDILSQKEARESRKGKKKKERKPKKPKKKKEPAPPEPEPAEETDSKEEQKDF